MQLTSPLHGLDPVVRSALVAVAGHGLGAPADRPPPTAPLGDRHWRSLMRSVRMERLLGLLDRAVADGAVPATAEQAADAEAAAAQSLRTVLHLERRLLTVADHLDRAAVPFVVLKGPAVARLDEPDPSMRNYADIDLLVGPPDLARAVTALGALGYVRDLPERRPGFDRSFGKEVPMADDRGSELDLHRTLALGSFGLCVDLPALWGSTEVLRLGGRQLTALDAEGRFVHACVTAALGDERPRLVALRDVASISSARPLADRRLHHLAPAGRGAVVVALAVRMCRAALGDVVGSSASAFAASVTPSRWERVALRAYRAQGGSNTLELLSGVLAVRGQARARYVRALVAPDAAYLDARRRAGRPREWTTGLREVASRRRATVGKGSTGD